MLSCAQSSARVETARIGTSFLGGTSGGILEQAVKQRLVGAMVLAAIAVVTLPIIFDAERTPSVQVPETIPPAPSYPPVITEPAKPAPLPPDRPTEEPTPVADMYSMAQDGEEKDGEEKIKPAAETVQTAVPATNTQAVAPAIATGKPVPAVPPAPGGKLNASGTPEGWVVQVAAMSDRKKVDALVAELKLRGYTVFTHTTQDDKGKTTRVYVGPKLDKAQAVRIKQQIDREQKLQTIVKPFAP